MRSYAGNPTSYWAAPGVGTIKEKPSLNTLLELTAQYFEIPVEKITSPARNQEIVMPRHAFMWLAYEHFRYTTAASGKAVNRSHCDVIHAVKKISGLKDINSKDSIRTNKYKSFVLNKLF